MDEIRKNVRKLREDLFTLRKEIDKKDVDLEEMMKNNK